MTQKTHTLVNNEADNLTIDVMVGSDWKVFPAAEELVKECVREAVVFAQPKLAESRQLEITVNLSDNDHVQELNKTYLGKDRPTNVLSFATNEGVSWPDKIDKNDKLPLLLGDIVVAYGVIVGEAEAQDKKLEDHLAHMTIHGCLHLLGYDHQDNADAEHMEAMESKILFGLGIDDPYRETTQT